MNAPTFFTALYNDAMKFFNSASFAFIKFLIGIYVIILVVDIILLLVQRNVGKNLREGFLGMNLPPELAHGRKKLQKSWQKINQRLESGNPKEYSVAIIEADNIIDDLIKRMGYPGEDMRERLENIPSGQIEGIGKIKDAHQVRNRIIHEEGLVLSQEEAKKIIGNYEEFLKHFEVLD